MSKRMFVVVIASILLSVVLSACGSSKPQPVCRQDAPSGQYWTALADSISANNPRGICQLKDSKTGKVLGQQAGEKSFEEYVTEAKKTVESIKQCYNKLGQITTCTSEQINK